MSRKTVTWIAVGALAVAAVIVAAIVAYHVGADHSSGRVAVGPFRRSLGTPVLLRTTRSFPTAEALVLLLIGGVVGAAIAVLARPGGALAGHPAPAPPADPRWRELDDWHRWAHGAPVPPANDQSAPPAPSAPPADPAAGAEGSTPPAPPTEPA